VRGSPPWIRKALRIFLQCARALTHLHRHRCVHRDVKPSNVLFARKDGAVRLGDFGLAKVLCQQEEWDTGEGDDHGLPSPSPQPPRTPATRGSRCTVGTPSYASPEQLAGQPLGAATDVYALGLVLAELICPVQTQMERAAVLEGLRVRRELPVGAAAAFPALADLAVAMTEPEPAKRPTAHKLLCTARQVYRDLGRHQEVRGSGADAGLAASTPPKATVSRHRRLGHSHHSAAPHPVSGRWLRPRRSQHRQILRAVAAAAAAQQRAMPSRQRRGAMTDKGGGGSGASWRSG